MPMTSRLALHDIKLLLLRFAHRRPFHEDTGGGTRESNLNLIPHLMQVAIFNLAKEQAFEMEQTNLVELLEKPPEGSWKSAVWSNTGPLYAAVVALHLWSQAEWEARRVALLRHLMALAHARSTSEVAPPAFEVYKPYLLFFGLIQSLYEYFFKGLKALSSEEGSSRQPWWPTAVSRYIRSSDEELLAATPRLLSFFEEDLAPVESMEEFLDVMGMLSEVESQELVRLATTGSR